MEEAPSPDDPCPCGVGKRYADCHKPIADAPKGKAIAVGQKQYANEWAINAEAYQSQGVYSTLARELAASGDVRRILDVGCGLGHGIQALSEALPKDRVIIGIDENPECLRVAAEHLGLPVDAPILQRLVNKRQLSGAFETTIKSRPLTHSGNTTLVNVDMMLLDRQFKNWLDRLGPFDAITLWFSGVHKARSQTKISKRFEIKDDEDHREVLQEKIFELAEQQLRPGGLIHIANRVAGLDLEVIAKTQKKQWEAVLIDWPFALASCTAKPYVEPDSVGAIQVQSRSFNASGMPKGVLSLIFVRSP
jgi:predicted O-methyltransferase YrrM